jgi:hypothetical protein
LEPPTSIIQIHSSPQVPATSGETIFTQYDSAAQGFRLNRLATKQNGVEILSKHRQNWICVKTQCQWTVAGIYGPKSWHQTCEIYLSSPNKVSIQEA